MDQIFQIVEYAVLGLFALIVLICVIKTIVGAKKPKQNITATQARVETGNKEQNNQDAKEENEGVKISLNKSDIILQPRKMVVVAKKGQIKPGKYTVLSAYENEDRFNIRIGNFVKAYKHGQEIILAEGDEICPTSTTIILR